jgi:hypothetical protein
MKRLLVGWVVALGCGFAGTAMAAPFYVAVDLDSSRLSGTDTSATFATQPGFTSWDVTTLVASGGNTLTLSGATFELFGFSAANQSRIRPTGGGGGTYDALLSDFVYNEGASGRAIGLRITGLDVGSYTMQSWHYDSTSSVTTTENFMRIEARTMGDAASTVTLVTKQPFGTEPVSFSFDVTAAGQVKEIIFREDDGPTATDPTDQNRARLNGFTLVPEPSSLSLLLLAVGTFFMRRNQSRISAGTRPYQP